MHEKPFKLVRAGRRTAWVYRQKGRYLADLNSENICGEFDSLEATTEAARQRLVTDIKAVFFICDSEGKVEGEIFDETVRNRETARARAVANTLVALFVLLGGVTFAQYLGFQLVPVLLYYIFATLVSASILWCLIEFPWDTKIILIFIVVSLLVLGHLRH